MRQIENMLDQQNLKKKTIAKQPANDKSEDTISPLIKDGGL